MGRTFRSLVPILAAIAFHLALAPCLLAAAPGRAASAPAPLDAASLGAGSLGAGSLGGGAGLDIGGADALSDLAAPAVLVLALGDERAAHGGGGDPLAWLADGVAALLSESLRLARVPVVDGEVRDALLAELGVADASRLTLASACITAREAGASRVVTGSWDVSDGGTLRIAATVHDVRRLRVVATAEALGPVDEAAGVASRVARRLVGELAGTSAATPVSQPHDSPLAARLDTPLAARLDTPLAARLDTLLDASPQALAAWMQAAAEPDLAEAHLEAALAAEPTHVPSVLALAAARLDAGRPEEVVPLLARLASTAPAFARRRALVLEGRAWLALGETVAAITSLSDAVRRAPSREALLWLAEAHLAAGQSLAATDAARRVLETAPGDGHALDVIARAEAAELG